MSTQNKQKFKFKQIITENTWILSRLRIVFCGWADNTRGLLKALCNSPLFTNPLLPLTGPCDVVTVELELLLDELDACCKINNMNKNSYTFWC